VCLLEAKELGERFPWLRTDDLAAGTLGLEGEGWLDPYSLLRAFRAKARDQGVTFLDDRVVGLGVETGRVSFALLEKLGPAPVGAVVNAAGPRARDVARMAGILDLPVESRKRFVYRFRCQEPVEGVPLTVDPSGVYFRPEGPEFLCGVSPPEAEDAETTDLEMDYGLFHDTIWPVLAHRVPAFQAIRLGFSWAGHYAVNTVDHNAILGPHPDVPNLYLANGFSGHGLQQSPAVGRALSELLLDGEYRTLDLSRMGIERLAAGELLLERNVV
jgi:glycine/D-amino acid oxidase-like deaminating enzyme